MNVSGNFAAIGLSIILFLPCTAYSQAIKQPQSATGTSTDQTGGITAGAITTLNYYQVPPVTDQERAIALERLNLTLAELATYRERPTELGRLTTLEEIRTDKTARRLYLVLSSFFDPTIAQAKNGKDLVQFKKRYSRFVRAESENEQRSLEYIGQHGPTKFSGGWEPLLRYIMLRAYRGSKDATISAGVQLIEVNYDQAEAFYEEFIASQDGGSWFIPSAQELEAMIHAANELLKPFQDD